MGYNKRGKPSTLIQNKVKLILLSPESNYDNEIYILHQLFEEGLQHFHLRKPNWSKEEVEDYLQQIDQEFLKRIVLHQHYELVEQYELKGIHLKSDTKYEVSEFRVQISRSCHYYNEVDKNDEFEYVFLSPIYDSISKEGYKAKFIKEELKQFLDKERKVQVIALGGLKSNNIQQCIQLGVDGVAILGGIWQSENPVQEYINCQLVINNCKLETSN